LLALLWHNCQESPLIYHFFAGCQLENFGAALHFTSLLAVYELE